jgi:hypothetical protein
MLTTAEVTAAALRIHAVASFGPSSFDAIDAQDAAESAMSPALSNSDWVITADEFTADEGWEIKNVEDGVRDMRRVAGARRIGRSHVRSEIFDYAAQVELSDGRFLTFVERG